MKEPEILEVTMIDFHEERITKKDLLKKFEKALDKFTPYDTLHYVGLRAIVRDGNQTFLERLASELSELIRGADSACD